MPRFGSYKEPDPETLAQWCAGTDWPCAWRPALLRASSSLEGCPVAFSVEEDGEIAALALGILTKRFLRSQLHLPTPPRFRDETAKVVELFWNGVRDFCRRERVEIVALDSFEALAPQPPPWPGAIERQERVEYFVDLRPEAEEIMGSFSSSHRRNIRKALRQGASFRILRGAQHLESHLSVFAHTRDRRRTRGESLPWANPTMLGDMLATSECHLAQLHLEDELLSSFVMVTTPTRALYFAGGTSERGMKLGSSQALMWCTIEELKRQGVETLSLGGTAEGSPDGLVRFKRGFGASEVPLVNYRFATAPPLLRTALGLLRLIRGGGSPPPDTPAMPR